MTVNGNVVESRGHFAQEISVVLSIRGRYHVDVWMGTVTDAVVDAVVRNERPHFSLFSPFLFSSLAVTKAFAKGAAASVPVAALAAPAFAMDSIVDALPSTSLSLEVQFGAYLAVLLGTFLPCLFLINLYIQTETRKAGAEDALKDEF